MRPADRVPMTDRFRYLPCEWHEALYAFHLSEPAVQRAHAVGFKPRADGWRFAFRVLDLAHPAGWDHAVRAYAVIRGVPVPESASVAAIVSDVHRYGADVVVSATGTPEERRRELCTRICAALNLNPEEVFPDV